MSAKPERQLASQLSYRLSVPEGPGAREFQRYLTPQLIPARAIPESAVNNYVNMSIMLQAAQERP